MDVCHANTYPQTKNKTYAHITLQLTIRIGTAQIAVAFNCGEQSIYVIIQQLV